ncbi:hypothetical protein JCM11641_006874 [Rhodosporidiobolus odoratus]
MPYTHQPRRRARCRSRLPFLAVICTILSCTAFASSSPSIPSSSDLLSLPASAKALSRHAVLQGDGQDLRGWRLHERAESATEDGTTTSTTPRALAAAATIAESSTVAASVDPAGQTVLSVSDSVATATSGDLVVASSTSPAEGTGTSTTSSAVSTDTSVPANYQLPEAFDSTLGTNFTSTACPSFFSTFLADSTFTSCAPFSLLLTTSTAFFTAERSPHSLLPHVLDASCSADTDTCTALMDKLTKDIKQSNTCGPDLTRGNPLAVEALQGFMSYRLYREAGCQKSNTTNTYCFAEAAANSKPDDLYLYYIGEGTSLPSGTTPKCDSCAQGLFSIYSRYAGNSTLPVSKSYASARSAISVTCGPSFAPVVSVTTSSSPRYLPISTIASISLPLLLALACFTFS